MKIVEVLIERSIYILDRPFTYVYLGTKVIGPGFRVLIDFNEQTIVGYVLSCKDSHLTKAELEEELDLEIKEIKDVLDEECLLSDELLSLADFIKDYYLSPKIKVLQTMLPPSLKPTTSSLSKAKIAYEQFLVVLDDNEEGLTIKQKEILRIIKENGKVAKRDINSPSIVKKLIECGRLGVIFEEKHRFNLPKINKTIKKALTKDQLNAVEEILNNEDSVFLLQGVTGSGKSEVYLSLAEQILGKGKNVLMLVPEISLTPMIMEQFLSRFNDNIAILHSQLTPAEKYDEYRKITRGEARIVIGARSAIFAPLENIGLIIMDEEHSESYKQDVAPYYHAREIALERIRHHNAKLILGSATPSLESRARAQNGIYHLVKLENRINQMPLPLTTIVDMTQFSNIDKDSVIFSLPLRNKIKERLLKKEQIILLLNRRGYSTSLACRKCGHVFKCPECGVALTYHKNSNLLKCHHCEYVEEYPSTCPECDSPYFIKVGYGVERIEDEIARLFPTAKTLRLDSDNSKIKTRLFETINSFKNKEADILIGTQMIAKGHDFENVTLVGVVLADIGLSLPNYRSSERAFQLITQAIGRAGRSFKKGEAVIQTYSPNHYSITLAARQNYDLFYLTEMKLRKSQFYPPYCYMTSINVSGKTEANVVEAAFYVASYLREELGNEAVILGPSSPFISFTKGKYNRTIILKYKNNAIVRECLKTLIKPSFLKSSINISINIDPYDY